MSLFKSTLAFAMAFAIMPGSALSQFSEPESCTSIMVGKKASTDGSVITSHTCDGNYRTWMDVVPATAYDRDTVAEVYTGRMHTDFSTGTKGMKLVGKVPQPAKTYSFLNTAYPCLNEKQLGIGETTISGRDTLRNGEGLFYIEELERIALQRCATAREAITLIGQLVEEYGYGDSGECLTIADPKEVWHFEIFGEGPDKVGGVWAAVRIPDDHVGVSANVPRIGALNLKDKNNYMASKNVFDVAKKLGFWDGKEPFSFWKAYSGKNYMGEPKNYSVRELFIFDALAPSLGLTEDIAELPISIKPDSLVSVEKVMNLLTETYEGTDKDPLRNLKVTRKARDKETLDTITSPAANPWMSRDVANMINAVAPGTVSTHRLVSVPQCAYSTVIQLRDWLPDDVGGVAWVAFDNPGQSPRIPIFSGTTDVPAAFKLCGQHRYDEDAAVWAFRRANKLATMKWGASRGAMEKAYYRFQTKGTTEMPFVEARYKAIAETAGQEAAREFLTNYTADYAAATMARWNELGDQFWNAYGRGY